MSCVRCRDPTNGKSARPVRVSQAHGLFARRSKFLPLCMRLRSTSTSIDVKASGRQYALHSFRCGFGSCIVLSPLRAFSAVAISARASRNTRQNARRVGKSRPCFKSPKDCSESRRLRLQWKPRSRLEWSCSQSDAERSGFYVLPSQSARAALTPVLRRRRFARRTKSREIAVVLGLSLEIFCCTLIIMA